MEAFGCYVIHLLLLQKKIINQDCTPRYSTLESNLTFFQKLPIYASKNIFVFAHT